MEITTTFMTNIENLCRQINYKIKKEDICIYILKGLKENILHITKQNMNLCNIE